MNLKPTNPKEVKNALREIVKELLPDIIRQSSTAVILGTVQKVNSNSSTIDVQTVQGNLTFKGIKYIADNGSNLARIGDVCSVVTMDPKSSNATFALVFGSTSEGSLAESGLWQSYEPEFDSTGTTPSVGNGTLEGQYMAINDTIFAQIRLVWGSTSSAGTGTFLFGVPFATQSSMIRLCLGAASLTDIGTQNYAASAVGEDTRFVSVFLGGTGGRFSGTNPFTIANGDVASVNLVYNKNF